MAGRRLEREVDCLVSDLEKERLFLFIWLCNLIKPIDCLICKQIRVVSLKRFSFAIDVEGRVKISPLPGIAHPMIKTLSGSIIFMSHVPLANISRSVAGFLKIFGEEHGPFGNGALVVHHPVMSHILSRKDGSPTW